LAWAAATAIQPQQVVQKFKAEPLPAKSNAYQQRSKNNFTFH
jgi:hypothetical protein